MRALGQSVFLLDRGRVHLIIAFPGSKELLDKRATRNVGGLAKKVLHICIQVMQPSFCDGIGHIAHGAGHVRECSLLGSSVARLGRELCEKRNLEIVKVLIVPGKFPVPPIFELRLDNKPILVLCKAVTGYPGRDGGVEFRRRARYKLRLLGVGSRLRRATEGALWGLLGDH